MRFRRVFLFILWFLVAVLCGRTVVTSGDVMRLDVQGVRAAPSVPSSTTTTEPPVTMIEAPTTTEAPAAPEPVTRASGDGSCANPVISEETARRESGCRWDAYNPTGCGGRGCLGFLQLDEGHFYAVSPWNPNVAGTCADLADVKWEPWAQIECGLRLGPGAWSS